MATRRQPPPPVSESPLPPELRRENVTVESFIGWDEQPRPEQTSWTVVGEGPEYLAWRRLAAWRRWQAAVVAWGAERGMDRAQLRTADLWPVYPPRFDRVGGRGR